MISYLEECKIIIEQVMKSEENNILHGANLMTRTVAQDGVIHVSGGHCHIYAMETFYRAGGLVPINPLLPLTIPSYERGVARLLRYDRHP